MNGCYIDTLANELSTCTILVRGAAMSKPLPSQEQGRPYLVVGETEFQVGSDKDIVAWFHPVRV